MARLLGRRIFPYTKKVASSVSGQDTYLGCRFDPQMGCVREETDRCLSVSLPFPLPQINKYILR